MTEFKGGFAPFITLEDWPIIFGTEKYEFYLISSEKIGRSLRVINGENLPLKSVIQTPA